VKNANLHQKKMLDAGCWMLDAGCWVKNLFLASSIQHLVLHHFEVKSFVIPLMVFGKVA
jgi:hypothetical protein